MKNTPLLPIGLVKVNGNEYILPVYFKQIEKKLMEEKNKNKSIQATVEILKKNNQTLEEELKILKAKLKQKDEDIQKLIGYTQEQTMFKEDDEDDEDDEDLNNSQIQTPEHGYHSKEQKTKKRKFINDDDTIVLESSQKSETNEDSQNNAGIDFQFDKDSDNE